MADARHIGAAVVLLALAVARPGVGSPTETTSKDPRPVLALLSMQLGSGFTAQESLSVEEVLLSALEDTGRFRVVGRSDVATMLDVEAKKQAQGCDDTGCMAAIAGALGADYVASASLGRIGEATVLTFKVIDARKATVLVHAHKTVAADAELIAACTDIANQVVAKVFGSEPAGAMAPATPVPLSGPREQVIVRFTSTPAGAVVSVDDRFLCQATPCSRAVAPGRHEVRMEKERYGPAHQQFNAEHGVAVDLTLVPAFGTLALKTVPPGLAVSINGEPAGSSPVSPRELDPGTYETAVDDPCFLRAKTRVVLRAGDSREVKLLPQVRNARLHVTAADAAGNDLEGVVVVDGQVLGSTPGTFDVPLCAKSIEVTSPDGHLYKSALSLKENVAGSVRALFVASSVVAERGEAHTLPAAALTPAVEERQTGSSMSTGLKAGIALAVLGGGFLLTGAALAGTGSAQWTALDTHQTGSIQQQASSIHSLELSADILFGIGAGLAIIGVPTAVVFR